MTPAVVMIFLPIILFCSGVFLVISRKNFFAIILGLELIFNASAFNFAYFSSYVQRNIEGQIFSIVIIIIAVAQAVVMSAIVLRFEKIRKTIHVDVAVQLQS